MRSERIIHREEIRRGVKPAYLERDVGLKREMTDKPKDKNFFLFLFLVLWSIALFIPTVVSITSDDPKVKNTLSTVSIGLHVFSVLFFSVALTVYSLSEMSRCCFRWRYQEV